MIQTLRIVFLTSVIALGIWLTPAQAGAATMDSSVGVVVTASSSLNVRSSASASASRVATLWKGSYVTLISKSGSWWQVEYAKGQYGYCHADYITSVSASPEKVHTRSTTLNVRSGPGTSYGRAASLARDEVVLVLSESGGWSRIVYHGTKTGYVSSQYLSAGTVAANEAVSLWLHNFKQTDSRWSGTYIGQSGKTIAQIGCATTAVAMLESHRTGKIIYPDDMAQQLRYTASGNLYWPEHYTVITESAGYLNKIYALLKQGKPVLFGARNVYGSQHWVVITGFTGGSITAGNFTIHDPGTYSRTTLQQFLDAYPNIYKYFHY